MMPVTIEKQITIAAKAATIWRYIGTEAGLRQWWGRDIALEEKPGGRCEERTLWQGRTQVWRGAVTHYAPPHQLALLLRNPATEESWPAWMTISLTLVESNGQTQVILHQEAFGALPVDVISEVSVPIPSASASPQPMWNRPQRQPTGDTGVREPPTVGTYRSVYFDRTWLVQSEGRWDDALQALVYQVLLTNTASCP